MLMFWWRRFPSWSWKPPNGTGESSSDHKTTCVFDIPHTHSLLSYSKNFARDFATILARTYFHANIKPGSVCWEALLNFHYNSIIFCIVWPDATNTSSSPTDTSHTFPSWKVTATLTSKSMFLWPSVISCVVLPVNVSPNHWNCMLSLNILTLPRRPSKHGGKKSFSSGTSRRWRNTDITWRRVRLSRWFKSMCKRHKRI